jgi:hypothetical protein
MTFLKGSWPIGVMNQSANLLRIFVTPPLPAGLEKLPPIFLVSEQFPYFKPCSCKCPVKPASGSVLNKKLCRVQHTTFIKVGKFT